MTFPYKAMHSPQNPEKSPAKLAKKKHQILCALPLREAKVNRTDFIDER